MVEDLLDHDGVSNAGNDLHIAFCATLTLCNVDIEHTLEPLCLTHAFGIVRLVFIFE